MDATEVSANIFLVEDSSDDEYFIRRAMERLYPSIRIRVAGNSSDALEELLAEDALIPNLVLIDTRLPERDWFEVLERLRPDIRYRSTPLVVLTSSIDRMDIDRAYDAGANGYIQKPEQFDLYVEKFASLLEYWLVINVS